MQRAESARRVRRRKSVWAARARTGESEVGAKPRAKPPRSRLAGPDAPQRPPLAPTVPFCEHLTVLCTPASKPAHSIERCARHRLDPSRSPAPRPPPRLGTYPSVLAARSASTTPRGSSVAPRAPPAHSLQSGAPSALAPGPTRLELHPAPTPPPRLTPRGRGAHSRTPPLHGMNVRKVRASLPSAPRLLWLTRLARRPSPSW